MSDPETPKPPVRRPRKTPEERGVVGWWAYRTMDTLGLTDEQIAYRVGVGSAAIRKFMGSPKGELGAESRAKMLAYYREVAANKQIPIDEPPVGFIVAGSGSGTTGFDPATYLAKVDSLVAELQADRLAWAEDRRLIRDLLDLLVRPPDDPVEQAETAAKADVLVGEEAAARELERTRLTPPRSGPRNPDGARRRTSREGETA